MGRGISLALRSTGWALAATGAVVALRLSVGTLEAVHGRVTAGGSVDTLPLADLVAAACAAVLTGAVLWLLLVTAATLVEVLTGRAVPAAQSLSPTLVRRLVLAGCGLAVATATVAPASAAAAGPDAVSREGLAGLPLPDRTKGAVVRPTSNAGPAHTGEAEAGTHRVRAGESLWSIAASLLPPGTGAQDVDVTWRRVYRANRAAVGDDPDLLSVGTVLGLPTTATSALTTPGNEPTTPDGKDA